MRRFLHAARHRSKVSNTATGHVEIGLCERELISLSKRLSGGAAISFKITVQTPRKLKAKDIENALSGLQLIHPILQCRVAGINGKFVFQPSPDVKIPVLVCKRDQGDLTCEKIFLKDLQRSQFTSTSETPHKVFLIQNDNDKDDTTQDIMFHFEHYACDGRSMLHLFDDFFSLLSRENENDTAAAAPVVMGWTDPSCVAIQKTLNPTDSLLGAVKMQSQVALAIMQMVKTALTIDCVKIKRNPSSSHLKDKDVPHVSTTVPFTHTLSKEEFQLLRQACKRNHATITTAVCEAYSRAFGESAERDVVNSRPRPVSLVCVQDIRSLINPPVSPRALTPMVGTLNLVSPSLSWTHYSLDKWALAQFYRQAIQNVSKTASLLSSMTIPFTYSALPTSQFLPSFAISSFGGGADFPVKPTYGNITVKDLELFQNFNFSMNPTLSIYPADPQGHRLRITWFATTPFYDMHTVEQVSQRAKEILVEMMQA